jgi:hypothetical protein
MDDADRREAQRRGVGNEPGDHERGVEQRGSQEKLAARQQLDAGAPAPEERRRPGAADRQARQEDGQDDREGVRRSAEEQRQQPRPHHLAAERGHSGQSGHQVDDPDPRARSENLLRRTWFAVRRAPGGPPGQPQGRSPHHEVEGGGYAGGRLYVPPRQQVEAGQAAAQDGPGGVGAVKEPDPGGPARPAPVPPGDGGQRRAHQGGRRQDEHGCRQPAQRDVEDPVAEPGEVDRADGGQRHRQEEPEQADADLQRPVDPQGMGLARDDARQQHASQKHPAHEGRQENRQRQSRRADDQAQKMNPDHFVDERGAAAGEKESAERGVHSSFGMRRHRFASLPSHRVVPRALDDETGAGAGRGGSLRRPGRGKSR